MPPIKRKTKQLTAETNGEAVASPIPGGKSLADVLRGAYATDTVEIKSDQYTPGEEDATASWVNVQKIVKGIRWQAREYLPYGMLIGVIAEPKKGKSALALGGVVRAITTGCGWFGMPGPEPGNVVWVDTERRAAINLDRAVKWGLPLDRIKTHFLDGPLKVIDIANDEHINRIFDVVCRYKARLVAVDSFRGAYDGNENDSTIGPKLQKLAMIAEQTNTSVLVIHHTKKIGLDEEMTANSGRGSNAFLAMVVCQWAIDQPDPDSDWRRLRVLGENLGIAPPPIGFRISDTGVEFGLAPERLRKETTKDKAGDFLKDHMKPGKWYPCAELLEDAKQFGFSVNAIQRAREELGIVKPAGNVRKVGKNWEWKRPRGD